MNIEISPKEYEKRLNWHDAMLYCQLLIIDGKDDWRLPTLDELIEIYNSEIENDLGKFYWTSTEYDDFNAWRKNMTKGLQYFGNKYHSHYVRAVRSI